MEFIGEFSALGAAFLWSISSFVFTALALRIGIIQLNISRMILASFFLFITIYIFDINYFISFEQFFYLSLSGIIGLLIGDTFLFKAFEKIGPRITMLVMSTNPAIAAITAFFVLSEVLSLWGILGIIVTISGISLVVLEKHNKKQTIFKITKLGLFFAVLAAVGQGVGLVIAKMAYAHGDIHTLVATFVRIFSAVIIMLPLAILVRKFKNPFRVFSKDKKSLGLITIGSIIGPYMGITLSLIAIIYTKVGIASTLMATAPIIMLPLSRIIYKEKLSWQSIAGTITAVSGIAILFLK